VRKFVRAVFRVALILLALLLLLPWMLYIPAVQREVCRLVVEQLNDNSLGLSYSVGMVRLRFPLELNVHQVAAFRATGDTLLYVERLHTGLNNIPVFQENFVVNRLGVEGVVLGMDSLTQRISLTGQVDQLEVRGIAYNPVQHALRVDRLSLDHFNVAMTMRPSRDTIPGEDDEPSTPWNIEVRQLQLRQGEYLLDRPASQFFLHTAFENFSATQAVVCTSPLWVDVSSLDLTETLTTLDLDSTAAIPYYDYNHMDFHHIMLSASAIHYDSDLIAAQLHSLSAEEYRCGMNVQELSADFRMDSSLIRANDFHLKMPGTQLDGSVLLDYHFFTDPHPGLCQIQLAGSVAGDDVVRYAGEYLPDLMDYWPDETVTLQVDGYANRDSLTLTTCRLSIPERLDFEGQLRAQAPFDARRRIMSGSLDCALLRTDSLISALVDRPERRAYRLPDSLNVQMQWKQRNGQLQVEGALSHGDDADVTLDATYAPVSEQYEVKLSSHGMRVQEFVPSLALRCLSVEAEAHGRKTDLRAAGAKLIGEVKLDTLVLDDTQRLADVLLTAHLDSSRYQMTLTSHDERIRLAADASGLLTADTLTSSGKMEVEHLQLSLIPPLSEETGFFSLHPHWELASDWKQRHALQLRIDSLYFDRDGEQWDFDEVSFNFRSQERYLSAVLLGGDCHATLQVDRGMEDLSAIIDTLATLVERQVQHVRPDFVALQRQLPQMDLRVNMLRDNPFYPVVSYYQYGFSRLALHLHNDQALTLDLDIIDGEDATQHFDTLCCTVTPLLDSLTTQLAPADCYRYALNVVHTAPRVRRSYNMHAMGKLYRDSVTLHFDYVDGLKNKMYDLGASLATAEDTLTLHFMDHPVIYAQPLEVNPQNYLRLTSFLDPEKRNLGVAANLEMSGPEGFTMSLQTRPDVETAGNRLSFNLHHLDLDYLRRTVQWSTEASGVASLDGALYVRPDSISGGFDVRVDNLRLGSFAADSLTMHSIYEEWRRERGTFLTMDIDTGRVLYVAYRERPASESSSVTEQSAASVDASIEAQHLPLALVNTYMPDNIRLDGLLNATLLYSGEQLNVGQANGVINFEEGSVHYADADATIHLPHDTLRMEHNKILFNNYALTAAGKNPVRVQGTIDFTQALSTPHVDLTLRGENVQLMKSTRCVGKEQYISGSLPANVNLKLYGVSPNLALTGSVSALSSTALKYYLQDDPLKSDSKLGDLVEFVSFQKLNRRSTSLLLTNREQVAEGFLVNMRIDVARNAQLDIHLSSAGEDNIGIRGGGALQFSMNPDGTTHLNGTYDITGGDVAFKLPMLPMVKSFDIVDGSTLRWNGETENPEFNITATEEVRCTINDESGVSRVVKFEVYVYIQGTMNDMSLTFSCAAPEDASIQNQITSLTDEERSKQAIRLLVTQSYSGPGVTTSSSMASANGAINALLQREVESFFNQHLKNTQISVGIDTYDADGTGTARTDYSVKISQRLFNDRIRIVLGGRVSSGDESDSNNDNAIINDFSLEWLLREDGAHYLRLFRKTNYESILEGEIVETGVGYVMQRSAYRLRDIFIPSSEKRRRRMLEQIRTWDLNQPTLPRLDSLLIPKVEAQ
jgi:hypothetical protein